MNLDEFEAVKSRVRRPDCRRSLAAGDRRRLRRHQHAGVLPLGHPLRHSLVAIQAPATERSCFPPRPGPRRQRPLLPLRPGRGHELPLLSRPEGRAGSRRPGQRRAGFRCRHPAPLPGQEDVRSNSSASWSISRLRTQSREKRTGPESPGEIADLTRRARELLESTDTRLGISPEALMDILRAAIAVEGQGLAWKRSRVKPGFYRLKPPPRWEGLARQTLTVGSRTDRMELVFDSALVGRRNRRSAGHAAEEASGLDAAGPSDHAAGDGHPLPPVARSRRPQRRLPLVRRGPAQNRASRPCWSSTTRSPPSTNCGNRCTMKFFRRCSASRGTSSGQSKTTSSNSCYRASSSDQVYGAARRLDSHVAGPLVPAQAELEKFLGRKETEMR